MQKRFMSGISAAAVLAVALTLSVTPAASALGVKSHQCHYYGRTFAGSSSSGGATTAETPPPSGPAGDCGNSGVRAFYRLYSGSPIYSTAWKYGSNYASIDPGNIIIGGKHAVTASTYDVTGRWEFGT